MSLILVVEPDSRHAAQLASMARNHLHAELVMAESGDRALAALADRVPDIVLTAPLLPHHDEAILSDYLRALGAAGSHVQTLTIPILSTPGSPIVRAVKGRFRRDREPVAPDGCDPALFAEQVGQYLRRARQVRTDGALVARPEVNAEPEVVAQPEAIEQPENQSRYSEAQPEPVAVEAMPHVLPVDEEVPAEYAFVPAEYEVIPADDVDLTEFLAEPPEPVRPAFVAEAPVHLEAPVLKQPPAAWHAPVIMQPPAVWQEPVVMQPPPVMHAPVEKPAAPVVMRAPIVTQAPVVTPPVVRPPVVTPPPVFEPTPLAARLDPPRRKAVVPEVLPVEEPEVVRPAPRSRSTNLPAVIRPEARPHSELPPANLPQIFTVPAPAGSGQASVNVAVAVSVQVAATAAPAPPSTPRQRSTVPKPVQDEWGFFDPDQCGFRALLARLDAIAGTDEQS